MLVALSSTAACGGKAADAPAADAAASSQGDAADAGSGEAGASPSDASANRLDATSAPEAGADAAAGAGAGLGSIYNGYFESYAFPSGSERHQARNRAHRAHREWNRDHRRAHAAPDADESRRRLSAGLR